MKAIPVICVMLLIASHESAGRDPASGFMPGDRSKIIYSVSNNSWLMLSGTTNVNSFECRSGVARTTGNTAVEAEFKNERVILSDAVVYVDIGSFDCRNPLINRDMHKAMGGDRGSVIEIRVADVFLHQELGGNINGEITANADITINGITQRKELEVEWSRVRSGGYLFEGSAELHMSDFMIDPPSPALGLVKVDDRIRIDFNYIVQPNIISRLD